MLLDASPPAPMEEHGRGLAHFCSAARTSGKLAPVHALLRVTSLPSRVGARGKRAHQIRRVYLLPRLLQGMIGSSMRWAIGTYKHALNMSPAE